MYTLDGVARGLVETTTMEEPPFADVGEEGGGWRADSVGAHSLVRSLARARARAFANGCTRGRGTGREEGANRRAGTFTLETTTIGRTGR